MSKNKRRREHNRRETFIPKGKGYVFGTCKPLKNDEDLEESTDDDELDGWWNPPKESY